MKDRTVLDNNYEKFSILDEEEQLEIDAGSSGRINYIYQLVGSTFNDLIIFIRG